MHHLWKQADRQSRWRLTFARHHHYANRLRPYLQRLFAKWQSGPSVPLGAWRHRGTTRINIHPYRPESKPSSQSANRYDHTNEAHVKHLAGFI